MTSETKLYTTMTKKELVEESKSLLKGSLELGKLVQSLLRDEMLPFEKKITDAVMVLLVATLTEKIEENA